jgi:hypothetical protein
MKSFAGGLTLVNLATVLGLLFGMVAGGLGPWVASLSLTLAAAVAILAYHRTVNPTRQPADASEAGQPKAGWVKYRNLGAWIMAAFFAMFAVRSFSWLLYIDGNDLKIQSVFNLGDSGLHITHIKFFANGVHLWPSNPIYVFSEHLRYPAGIDLFNALLSCLDVDLIRGLVWVGLIASAATFYAFYRWGGAFAVAGFLFNGGLIGFQFLRHLSLIDYQGAQNIAWKSIPLTMFVTQRGLLYAIPAGLLLLWHWREKYFRSTEEGRHRGPLPFWVELSLYASMPLFHLHTFLALSIALVCFFIAGNPQIRGHVSILLGAALLPATFFVWLITDHFHAGSVLQFHWGWVQRDDEFKMPFFRFWFFNFGILVPLVLTLVGLHAWRVYQSGNTKRFELSGGLAIGTILFVASIWQLYKAGFTWKFEVFLLLGLTQVAWAAWRLYQTGFSWNEKLPEDIAFVFAAVVIFIFTISVKTAPWGWDNLKIMVWSYFIVLPFLWEELIARWETPIRAAVCFALFGSGFVSLFGGLAVGRPGFHFANRGELDGTGMAVRKLPIEERFAAFPTYNHPLLLQGRKVALGYPGHLWTQGFADYGKANDLLTKLMQGTGDWRSIARTLQVRYIFWGREEIANYPGSQKPWEKVAAPVASGTWGTIYDLNQQKPAPAAP